MSAFVQAGVYRHPWGARIRIYADVQAADGSTITIGTPEMAFMGDGVDPAPITGGSGDWVVATIEDNGTSRPRWYVLVGPTGDSSASKQLAKGDYAVHAQAVIGTERVKGRFTLTFD